MSTPTEVKLVRNNGSETYRLKATRISTEVDNSLVTDSIISGVSRAVVGGKFVLDLRTFDITFEIQGMEPGDYPNSAQYSDHDYGFRWQIERAALEWGFTVGDGFDDLEYDGRTFNGVITSLNIVEDTEQRKRRTYDGSLEWTYLDAYVSQ
jgi:hypothetical protein